MAWPFIAYGLLRLAAHVCKELDRGSSSSDTTPASKNPMPNSRTQRGNLETKIGVSCPSSEVYAYRLCFKCGTQNRFPINANEELAKCGKCKSSLSMRGAINPVISKYVNKITCPYCQKADFTFLKQSDNDVELICNSCKKRYFTRKLSEYTGSMDAKVPSYNGDPPGLTMGYKTCRKCGYDYRESAGKCSRCT